MSRRREQAFDKSMRLLAAGDFHRVFADGKRYRGREFIIIARANGLDRPRLGLAISRRSAPRAVDRNRLKRVVRETFRHRSANMAKADIVVQANPTARLRTNAYLSRQLDTVWTTITNNEN